MKGRWMLLILLAVTSAPGRIADAQDPPTAEAQGDNEQPLGEEEAMVLNFERADIREVIHSLATRSASATYDPRICKAGHHPDDRKIAREDLFPLLTRSSATTHRRCEVGDRSILPVAEAKTRAIIPLSRPSATQAGREDQFVIEIIPVRHVSATRCRTSCSRSSARAATCLSFRAPI